MSLIKKREEIIAFIRQSVSEAHVKGIVLGLSGGVDSALVAALGKEALGAQNVLGIIMPCESNPQDAIDAELVAKHLGIRSKTVDLGETYNALLKSFGDTKDVPRMAMANIKPRLRMTTLYFHGALDNLIVAGTGNKSEITIGYFTKYGDGGVDIMPIAGLLKHEVWEMSRMLDLPLQVIDKPPSAGLWEAQTDEGEMGFSYKELDEYIMTGKANPSVKERIDAMRMASEHKRKYPKAYGL